MERLLCRSAGGVFGDTSSSFAGLWRSRPGGFSGTGGGVEGIFADRWSMKLEYLYMGTPSTNDNLIRVGVNCHF